MHSTGWVRTMGNRVGVKVSAKPKVSQGVKMVPFHDKMRVCKSVFSFPASLCTVIVYFSFTECSNTKIFLLLLFVLHAVFVVFAV